MRYLLTFSIAILLLSGCKTRILDFTMLTNSQMPLVTQNTAKRVSGKSLSTIKKNNSINKALKNALDDAGPDYDALIDGSIYFIQGVFLSGYEVSGVPIKVSAIKASMTDSEFEKYCLQHNLMQNNKKN